MRGRIALVVAFTSTAIVLVFVIPLCLLVATLASDRGMAAADQEARTIAILVSSIGPGQQRHDLIEAADGRSRVLTTVLLPDGTTEGTPRADLAADPEVARARAGEAFAVVDARGGRVLVPVVVDQGTAVVRTEASAELLREGVWSAWLGIAGLGAGLAAVSLVVALQAGRRLAAPVRAVGSTAHALREGDLAARAEVVGPDETVELARALNGLADRIEELLASERAAVGDLAHRLRTPITALRLELDGVQPFDTALRLADHLTRLQVAIDDIVREARRPVRTDLAVGCNARDVIAARVSFWAPLADDQGRVMRTALPVGPVPVHVEDADVRDVIDILIDNVFAHTPEGAGFTVELARVDSWAVLTVSDAGPGFSPDDTVPPARVGSSGRGLEIVTRIVTAHGGRLERSESGRGASVTVRLPLDA